jgi:putative DNA primase/helicase
MVGDGESKQGGGSDSEIARTVAQSEPEPTQLDIECAKLPRNDTGNADRLVLRVGQDLIYLDEAGWHWWCGQYWMPQPARKSPDAVRLAQSVAAAIDGEARAYRARSRQLEAELPPEPPAPPRQVDGEEPKPDPHAAARAEWKRKVEELEAAKKVNATHAKFGVGSGNAARINALLAMAEPKLRKRPDEMDRDPLLFNTLSGTLELDHPDGTLGKVVEREHRRADYITHIAGTAFNGKARDGAGVPNCPDFLKFLEWAQPKVENQLFLQRWFGYCLTAINTEQVFLMFYGDGSNGKSVLMIIMEELMGSYAATVPIEVFLKDDRRRGGDATPELVPLVSARLALASEPEDSTRLSEAVAKKVTGGDKMNVRRLFEGMISIRPKFKVMLSFNNKPQVRGQDEGIWRRILLVPFKSFMPKGKEDKGLAKRLIETEGAAILNWALDGYYMWREIGLAPPPDVMAATAEYRAESDPVGKFLAEVIEPSPAERIKAHRLYEVYRRWCNVNGHHAFSSTQFGLRLKAKKIVAVRSDGIHYVGIGFNTAMLDELERKPFRNSSGNPSDGDDTGGGDPRDKEGYPEQ